MDLAVHVKDPFNFESDDLIQTLLGAYFISVSKSQFSTGGSFYHWQVRSYCPRKGCKGWMERLSNAVSFRAYSVKALRELDTSPNATKVMGWSCSNTVHPEATA